MIAPSFGGNYGSHPTDYYDMIGQGSNIHPFWKTTSEGDISEWEAFEEKKTERHYKYLMKVLLL